MPIGVRKGNSYTFQLRPENPMTDPSAIVYDREGNTLETASVSLDSTDTGVSADASTKYEFEVADTTGIERGKLYQITSLSQGGKATGLVSHVSGSTVTLVYPLPYAPISGSTVKGLEAAVTVSTSSTSDFYLSNLIELVDTDTNQTVTYTFDVCRYPLNDIVKPRTVREYMSSKFKAESLTEQWCSEVADESNTRIRTRLIATGRYLHSYWDERSFSEIGNLIMRLVLADKGFLDPGRDNEDYLQSLRFELRDRMNEILMGNNPYDSNLDGKIDDTETEGIWTIRMQR